MKQTVNGWLTLLLLTAMLGVQGWGLVKLIEISERTAKLESSQTFILQRLGLP